ncbi:MAG: hypothetical protein GYB67_03310, partial [Chloroflexi bacterium]|nr:hypothetical protein [Chloroflexota bacterium]
MPLILMRLARPYRGFPLILLVLPVALITLAIWLPASNLTSAALERAWTFSGGNADWSPVWHRFDGVNGVPVTMMLVPAGCFMMGSTADQVAYALELVASE